MSDTKRAAPPSPAPRPIARLLVGSAGLPLLEGVGEKVGVAVELAAITAEAVVETDDNEEAKEMYVEAEASTTVVSRRNTPCPFWQHEELLLGQHQLPSSHLSSWGVSSSIHKQTLTHPGDCQVGSVQTSL